MNSDPIIITDKAAQRIKDLLHQRGKPSVGIRIIIESKGCSGFKYKIEYADDVQKYDAIVNQNEVKVLIDPKAMLYILGSEIDYREDEFTSGFTFTNPNEKSKCGCGESFGV